MLFKPDRARVLGSPRITEVVPPSIYINANEYTPATAQLLAQKIQAVLDDDQLFLSHFGSQHRATVPPPSPPPSFPSPVFCTRMFPPLDRYPPRLVATAPRCEP